MNTHGYTSVVTSTWYIATNQVIGATEGEQLPDQTGTEGIATVQVVPYNRPY
jgi:hypothetical protein